MIKRRGRKPRASRPTRVPTPGLKGRLGEVDCSVGNLSPTGALVLTRHALPTETEWPLQIELPSGVVMVTCRVVRCESMEIQMPGAVWRSKDSALGVVFREAPRDALQAIRQLCKSSPVMEESAPRVLVIGRDAELSKLISRTLAEAEYVPRIITDQREASSVAKRIGAKVAVINLHGDSRLFDVVDTLREHPATRAIPIVGCLSLKSLSARQRAHLSSQGVRVLSLPLTPEDLIAEVDRALLDQAEP